MKVYIVTYDEWPNPTIIVAACSTREIAEAYAESWHDIEEWELDAKA